MLSNQGFNGLEVPIGKVFETPFTIEQSIFRRGKGFDRVHQVAIVVREFQFDRTE